MQAIRRATMLSLNTKEQWEWEMGKKNAEKRCLYRVRRSYYGNIYLSIFTWTDRFLES